MIDESTAVYVREVFSRIQNGEGTTEIARDFNLRGIPTPMMVKRQKAVTRNWNSKEHDSNIWTYSLIRKMATDERYTGSAVFGKMKRVKVGSSKSVPVPKEEWTVVPDMFPAIVSKELFAAVQEALHTERRPSSAKKSVSLFHRKIQCGYCGLASIFDSYEIVMEVKETEKSFIFKLIKLENRSGADRIQLLFSKSNKVILRKQNSGHAMRVWDDDNFTIYPYQAGIPYYFELIEDVYKETSKENMI